MRSLRPITYIMLAGSLSGLLALPISAQTDTPTRPADARQPDTPKSPGDAQPGTAPGRRAPRPPRSTTAAPKEEPAAAKRPEPTWGPYIKRDERKMNDIVVGINLNIRSDSPNQKERFRDPHTGQTVDMPKVKPFEFEAMSIVLPYITTTAGSDLMGKTAAWPENADGEWGYKGRLSVGERVVDLEPDIINNNYPLGTRLARWEAPKEVLQRVRAQTSIREVEVRCEFPVRCYQVEFDEKNASNLPWPRQWPAIAESALAQQMWIEKGRNEQGEVQEYDAAQLDEVLERYFKEDRIENARSLRPVPLAKYIAWKVWKHVSPSRSENVKNRARPGVFEGLEIRPPAVTLRTGEGSEHDMAVALVALYRRVGIPSRLVVGLDVGSDAGNFPGGRETKRLRSWVEFCLFDEERNTINWVPVDVVRLRKQSSDPQPLTTDWRYFGNHRELDQMAPIAFHLSPPADSVAHHGNPAFWGWMCFPKPPDWAQPSMTFSAGGLPKKAQKSLTPVAPIDAPPADKK